jgi:adenosylhomocysteinase
VIGCDVGDAELASLGQDRIERVALGLPELLRVRERFAAERPLQALRVSARLPVTPETANLVITLVAGGADVALCAAGAGSTDDAVAAALTRGHVVRTYAGAEDDETADRHLAAVLVHRPDLTMDAGASLVAELHRDGGRLVGRVLGGTEATVEGARQIRAMAGRGELRYPVVALGGLDSDRALADHALALADLAAEPGALGRCVHESPWRR